MLFVLLATVALGLGAAGLVLGLSRLTGAAVPRYLAPVMGGLAMAAFMLWNEYTWFDRASDALPEGTGIAEAYPYSSWLQPWTLAVPRIARFAAVAPVGERPYPEMPGLRLGLVFVAERLAGQSMIPHLFDCTGHRRAALTAASWEAVKAGTPPAPETLGWVAAGPDDPLVATACTRTPTSQGGRS